MRQFVVTYRRFIGGIKKPSVITSVEVSRKKTSAEAMQDAYKKAVSQMSSDWSVELVEITDVEFCDLVIDIDDFGIWMLTETAIKEGA